LGSLFVVLWTTFEHGRDIWNKELRSRVTSIMYRPSNPGEAKEPSNGSNHGSSVWRFVGKWINFVNQMKGSRIITAGVAHWGSKHIPRRIAYRLLP
jgi:hypothetical protein